MDKIDFINCLKLYYCLSLSDLTLKWKAAKGEISISHLLKTSEYYYSLENGP